MSHPQNSREQILIGLAFVALTIAGALFALWVNDRFIENNNRDQVPIIEPGQQTQDDNQTPKDNLTPFSISGEYTMPKGVGPYDNFMGNAPIVALNGNFKKVIIAVEGEILDDQPRFVSFTLNNTGGVLNAVRASATTLDEQATKDRGGVFESALNFDLDLFADTFVATTKDEFSQTHQLTKSIRFWDEIIPPPPTVFRFVVAPYDQSGTYGGVKIKSVTLKYQCDGACQVNLCELNEKTTVCLTRNFGKATAQEWCAQSKADGCEDL